jgi:hypothetical protein
MNTAISFDIILEETGEVLLSLSDMQFYPPLGELVELTDFNGKKSRYYVTEVIHHFNAAYHKCVSVIVCPTENK